MTLYHPPVDNTTSSIDVSPTAYVIKYVPQREFSIINNDAAFIVKYITIDNDVIIKELDIGQREYDAYSEMLYHAPWAKDFFLKLPSLNEPKLLFPYYKHIQSLMREKDFDAFSTLLKHIKIKDVNETLIIGLLRLTNPWKSRISAWNDFLEKAHIELTSREHSSAVLLRGLS